MLTKHLAVTYSMVWTLVIANVITVVLSPRASCHISRNSRDIRGNLIIPFLLLLVFVGSYTANSQIADLLVTLCFGVLGYLMVRLGWPRRAAGARLSCSASSPRPTSSSRWRATVTLGWRIRWCFC